ncbi:hypothetical protein [Salsuginibacillus kocurii]|uniref:hypothetical protein n=1 Tax=Salsuginibacillus kocurii TaxID=427078 RepID=UPI00035DFF32|nr:hypothetical protein [Salsuginibacillus kocurii]
MAKSIINFESLKEKKQEEANQALVSIYEKYFNWVQVNANLRDKVRAKHLFRQLAFLHPDETETKEWQELFEHWFAFDYVTIIGSRLFDLYIRKESGNLSASELAVGGLIMTSALEPVQIISERTGDEQQAFFPYSNEEKLLAYQPLGPLQSLNQGEWYLLRPLRCGFKTVNLGPAVALAPEVKQVVEHVFQSDREKAGEGHSLSYRKEKGIQFMSYVK